MRVYALITGILLPIFAIAEPVDSVRAVPDPAFHVSWPQIAVPATAFTLSAVMVRAHWGVKFRENVQDAIADRDGRHHTKVDNYLQYLPAVMPFALNACTYRGAHGWLDLTLLTALSYSTFVIVNQTMKWSFSEERPDSHAHNSFPSGHTGTAFCGAEILRREYWERNKLLAISGYAVAATVGYLRIHNNRHWINDVVGGAAVGYLSTTFAYWLYPRLFKHRARVISREREQEFKQRHPSPEYAAMIAPSPGGVAFAATVRF